MNSAPLGMGCLVTRLRPDHLDQVSGIEKVSFTQPWPRRLFEAELRHPCALTLACLGTQSRRLLGYLCLWLAADEVQVQNLAVHPDFRRQGVGRYLLITGLEQAREKGCVLATLEVRPSNLAARRLYASLGFKEVGRRPGYYPLEGEDALLLNCDLAAFRPN
ncbi:MAG: ribosomal protein S18-alanine N-acetyltransferase [Desulfarculaceae bacterium]|jgi:ribosomal-protein-alanine N-acetyltransferase